jgi:hypothetical protein
MLSDSSGRIDDLLLVPELCAVHLQVADSSYVPADSEVCLLDLPVLEEYGAPHTYTQCIYERVFRQEQPGKYSSKTWESKSSEVGLNESKVESNLGTPKVADLIQIGWAQENSLA